MAGDGAYTASKGAVRSLTKAAAVDYGKQNIRVNSVHPGNSVTPMSASHMEHPDFKQHFLNQIALPNLGQADEVAAVVLFLASDEANHISGIELPVDGWRDGEIKNKPRRASRLVLVPFFRFVIQFAEQLLSLFFRKVAPLSRREFSERDVRDTHTLEAEHFVAERLTHPTDLTVESLRERDIEVELRERTDFTR